MLLHRSQRATPHRAEIHPLRRGRVVTPAGRRHNASSAIAGYDFRPFVEPHLPLNP